MRKHGELRNPEKFERLGSVHVWDWKEMIKSLVVSGMQWYV
jgi:hypothetical protein